MKVPDLCLAVYMGFCYADSKPVAKIIHKCGFNQMNYGYPATPNEWFEMGFFSNGTTHLELNLKTHTVRGITKKEISRLENVVEVDVNDLDKCVSRIRTDDGKNKSYLNLEKLFNMKSYENIQRDYDKFCEKWIDEQIEEAKTKAKETETNRIREIIAEEKRKEEAEKKRIEDIENERRNKIYREKVAKEEREREEFLYRQRIERANRESTDFDNSAYGYPQLTHYD